MPRWSPGLQPLLHLSPLTLVGPWSQWRPSFYCLCVDADSPWNIGSLLIYKSSQYVCVQRWWYPRNQPVAAHDVYCAMETVHFVEQRHAVQALSVSSHLISNICFFFHELRTCWLKSAVPGKCLHGYVEWMMFNCCSWLISMTERSPHWNRVLFSPEVRKQTVSSKWALYTLSIHGASTKNHAYLTIKWMHLWPMRAAVK